MDTLSSPPEAYWPAPAKLNLFLHVVARRVDGFHDLQTMFQLIDLCDRIHIDVLDEPRVERVSLAGTIQATDDPADDLAIRAALALQAEAGTRAGGARIAVDKRIPVGGGLGGGSSDAATVLVALNALWSLDFSVERLAQIGLGLGSDVPLFVRGHSAWGEGRGERLRPMSLPARWYVVLHPREFVSTRAILQAPELTRNSPLLTIPEFLATGGRNDCEPVVRARHVAVAAALDWLAAYAPARLTGTGSCIFAGFASVHAAEEVAAEIPAQWSGFVARGLDVSPLQERLG
ncbi:MAG: 4-(cytidine 5'-diphospho)-2-C-methyl-D-erythritol kinase [Steroidobacteraceae bacterium]